MHCRRTALLLYCQVAAAQYSGIIPNYHWVPNHPVNRQYHCFRSEKDGECGGRVEGLAVWTEV